MLDPSVPTQYAWLVGWSIPMHVGFVMTNNYVHETTATIGEGQIWGTQYECPSQSILHVSGACVCLTSWWSTYIKYWHSFINSTWLVVLMWWCYLQPRQTVHIVTYSHSCLLPSSAGQLKHCISLCHTNICTLTPTMTTQRLPQMYNWYNKLILTKVKACYMYELDGQIL